LFANKPRDFTYPVTLTAINSRFWPATSHRDIKDTPLNYQKIGMWCAITRNQTTGPIFFVDTVNSECNCEVSLYTYNGHLNEVEIARGCFQKGGANTHIDRVFVMLLRDVTRGHNILKGHSATTVTSIFAP
jgi:hypothetical protein